MSDNTEGWITTRGVVVGWLQQVDGDIDEAPDIAVVSVTVWKKRNTITWLTPGIQTLVLRWVGNDYEILDGDEDNLKIGDTIEFVTNHEEQMAIAFPHEERFPKAT